MTPGDEWVFIGHTAGGKLYDADGNEVPAIRPEMPDGGIELGPGKAYWKPLPAPGDDG
jgi:hypothetical protein